MKTCAVTGLRDRVVLHVGNDISDWSRPLENGYKQFYVNVYRDGDRLVFGCLYLSRADAKTYAFPTKDRPLVCRLYVKRKNVKWKRPKKNKEA